MIATVIISAVVAGLFGLCAFLIIRSKVLARKNGCSLGCASCSMGSCSHHRHAHG